MQAPSQKCCRSSYVTLLLSTIRRIYWICQSIVATHKTAIVRNPMQANDRSRYSPLPFSIRHRIECSPASACFHSLQDEGASTERDLWNMTVSAKRMSIISLYKIVRPWYFEFTGKETVFFAIVPCVQLPLAYSAPSLLPIGSHCTVIRRYRGGASRWIAK